MQAGKHDKIRASWALQFRNKAHLKFFIGRETFELGGVSRSVSTTADNSYVGKADEVIVEAPDSAMGDVKKVRRICGFISSKVISHVLIVDVNSVVNVNAALSTPYESFDYLGTFDNWGDIGPRAFMKPNGETETIERCFDFAKGEHGVFLSRRAALEVADTPLRLGSFISGSNWDLWIGQVIGPLVGEEHFLTMPVEPVAEKTN